MNTATISRVHSKTTNAINHGGNSMTIIKTLLLTIVTTAALSLAANAQTIVTNYPLTKIENFETQLGVVLIKANSDIGTIQGKNGTVLVQCKETQDTSSGQKEYGLAIRVTNEQQEDLTTIDYDELDGLIAAIDYISRIDYSVTTLPNFGASFTTRGDFTIATYTSKRLGTIQGGLQSNRGFKTRVALTMEQMAQFRHLIASAKATLDGLQPAKVTTK